MALRKSLSLLLISSLLCAAGFLAPFVCPVGAETEAALSVDPRSFWHYLCGLYAQRTDDMPRALAEFEQSARYNPKSSAVHDRLAFHYLVEGMENKSEEELKKSISLKPNDLETRFQLAKLYASQGGLNKARGEYEEILRLDPKNTEARYYLAGILANENKTDDSLREYESILKDNPREAGVYYNMGLIYTRANQAGKAEEAFKKAIEGYQELAKANPDNDQVYLSALEAAYTSLGLVYELNQKPEKAIEAYQALADLNPDNAQAYLALGEIYYNRKQEQQALEAFRNYSQIKPDDMTIYDYIGLCYYRLGKYPEAVEAFQKLLNQETGSILIRYRLSAAYAEMGDYAGAEKQLKAIIAQNEKNAEQSGLKNKDMDAWVRLIMLYDKQKDDAKTEQTIREAMGLNPDHPELILMKALFDHQQNRHAEAEKSYRRVIALESTLRGKRDADYDLGTLAQACFNLGALLDKQGRFNEAIEQMKRVVQLQPDNAEAYNFIGYSWADKGVNLDEAKKNIETALKLDPNNAYYLDSLGWVCFQKGKYADARANLEKSIKLRKTEQKDDAVIFDHLGEVFLKLDQKQEAAAQWEKAMQLDPDNRKYRDKLKKIKPSASL
jgi:tetratricopeptide (TPR) repeat protein